MSEELHRSLGRVESKVDLLLERTTGFDTRLSKVERKVWYASGMSAVLSFIATHLLGRH